jgi:hypothetical protein
MAVVAVSRWKGSFQDLSLAKEVAPILKRAGAVAVRIGNCYAGAHAGQIFGIITFADWESYGKAMQALAADADYQRIYGQLTKTFELQERFISVVDDL